jgi:hypothetical protein
MQSTRHDTGMGRDSGNRMRAPGPLTVRVTLPASGGTVSGPFDGPPDYDFVPQCLDQHQRSTISVIGAYEAGTSS